MDPKVRKFLDSLKAQGLNDAQISKLSSLQGNKKKWKSTLKKQVNTVGRQAAASQGGKLLNAAERRIHRNSQVNGGRGKPTYKSSVDNSSSAGEWGAKAIGDMFSKNNPRSAPNAAAHGADKIVKGATGFAKGLGKRDENVRRKLSREAMRKAAARRQALASARK